MEGNTRIAIRNRYEGTTPIVLHANGIRDSRLWDLICRQFSDAAGKFSPTADHGMDQSWTDELTVLTWNTGDGQCDLINSCNVLGITPVRVIKVKVPEARPNTRITYPVKIEGTLHALPQINTEWVMMVDAFDAIFLEGPSKALDIAKNSFKDADVIFGAEPGHFPIRVNTQAAEKYDAAGHHGFNRPFLNSGMVLGKTKAVLDVYKAAQAVGESWSDDCLRTDQACLKTVFANGQTDVKIRLDYHSQIFQNLFGVRAGELELLYVQNGFRLEAV